MEKTQTPLEKETLDFMNVESFSQLPFIRPTPLNPKPEKPIKLFGIEFPTNSTTDEEDDETNAATSDELAKESVAENNNSSNNGDSNRRFECHYCCRNFPTSQALGGHQNAHKRERQHAKRAHLQSAMVHGSLGDYGFYRAAPASYPSWSTANNVNGSRYYGSHGYGGSTGSFTQQPINGSPLTMWRIPNNYSRNDNSLSSSSSVQPLALFAGENPMRPSMVSRENTNNSSHGRYVYEGKPTTSSNMQDHVSLDLHL